MSTLTWRIDKSGDDQDDLPACTTCRKRKLRCSRDAPACFHCSRTGSQCVYDSKSKPGLKTGAVEALGRRIAVLERMLLDKEGTPLVTFTPDGQVHGQRAPRAPDAAVTSTTRIGGIPEAAISKQKQNTLLSNQGQWSGSKCSHCCEKRKRSTDTRDGDVVQPNYQSAGDSVQALPPHEILLEVIDYFFLSFHHWIPFLHKARCLAEVQKAELNADLVPVLHALIAVALPRFDQGHIQLEHRQLHRQTKISRDLAMEYCMRNTSLQSLQVLLILVFDQLNDGESLKTYPLIALLVRTVDFLQLTLEPESSRSRVLMKPLNLLEPAHDWTEFEAQRRLFWCIFLLDRYTSAHTGWNISLTSEDVHRRLPADGEYFKRETPAHCPFFGLWNKSYANIGASLSAHVPAQYRAEEPTDADVAQIDTPTPVSTASVNSSNLGAFAYCIEATESLNQVTTFFLQQRIDWQNRQHVVDWLTRFKELDLRLIHWKMFLPPRWKDSDISTDNSQIKMDPNLTLAHLTHNTSMILLHYPVAFPPVEWSDLVPLPSACSAETCQLAAVETSRIADKFLQHTQIPFVNPQFSFCVFVAAKVLIASSHATRQQVLPEFGNLVQALWKISAQWLQVGNDGLSRERCMNEPELDLAGRYARYLEQINEKCCGDPEFHFDFFDHSCRSIRHSPLTPIEIPMAVIAEAARANPIKHRKVRRHRAQGQNKSSVTGINKERSNTGFAKDTRSELTSAPSRGQDRLWRQNSVQATQNQHSGALQHSSSHFTPSSISYPRSADVSEPPMLDYFSPENTMSQINDRTEGVPQPQNQLYDQNFSQDALFVLSDTLMDPQYMELDRVITFEEANFQPSHIDLGWP